MACRVGMTTDLTTRRAHWQSQYPNLRNWKVLATGLSREEAQKKEDAYAKAGGCVSSGGGNDPDKPKSWSVYRFEY